MDHVISCVAFLGAWCLVAGPIFQAAVELRAEELESDRIRAVFASLPQPEPVSLWWWLVPPVYLTIRRHRRDAFQEQMIAAIEDSDYDALMHYMDKALGWLVVGAGGLAIAAGETWLLCREWEWGIAVWVLIMAVMGAISTAFVLTSIRRTASMRQRRIELRADQARRTA